MVNPGFLKSSATTIRITAIHAVDEIYDEFEIIAKHGCTLENIDYHIPGIETPLTREIKTKDRECQ